MQAATREKAAPAKAKVAKPAEPRERDSRLPPPGTVLQKKDRQGNVRCECRVLEHGVEYNGIEYRSLSAAAAAAAKDLGIKCSQVNGFLFWNLAKAVARPVDQMGALNRAWERFHERASSLLADAKNDEVLGLDQTLAGLPPRAHVPLLPQALQRTRYTLPPSGPQHRPAHPTDRVSHEARV